MPFLCLPLNMTWDQERHHQGSTGGREEHGDNSVSSKKPWNTALMGPSKKQGEAMYLALHRAPWVCKVAPLSSKGTWFSGGFHEWSRSHRSAKPSLKPVSREVQIITLRLSKESRDATLHFRGLNTWYSSSRAEGRHQEQERRPSGHLERETWNLGIKWTQAPIPVLALQPFSLSQPQFLHP